jgi:hypothetical protein
MLANLKTLRLHSFGTERVLGIATLAMCLVMAACYNNLFDENTVMQMGSGQSLDIQSEQVSLSPEMLTCAVENGLFEAPNDTGSRTVARLLDKGRALGFSDDVTVYEPSNPLPYTQVRGKFPMEFKQVVSIRDVQTGVKRVEAKAGVRITHNCFTEPLLLMGVRNGTIAQKNPAAFEFDQYGNDWRMVSVLH